MTTISKTVSNEGKFLNEQLYAKIVPMGTQKSPFLTKAESITLFDRKARALLNISGNEFLKRLDAGEYKGVDNCRVMTLRILAPRRPHLHW